MEIERTRLVWDRTTHFLQNVRIPENEVFFMNFWCNEQVLQVEKNRLDLEYEFFCITVSREKMILLRQFHGKNVEITRIHSRTRIFGKNFVELLLSKWIKTKSWFDEI